MRVPFTPRILEHTKKLGLRGELSADLTTGWDLLLPEHKENLVKEIHRRRPNIVYLEPPCTWFSALLNMNWKKMPRHVRAHGMNMVMALLEIQPSHHAYPAVGRPGVCAGTPLGGNLVDAPMGSALPHGVPSDWVCRF